MLPSLFSAYVGLNMEGSGHLQRGMGGAHVPVFSSNRGGGSVPVTHVTGQQKRQQAVRRQQQQPGSQAAAPQRPAHVYKPPADKSASTSHFTWATHGDATITSPLDPTQRFHREQGLAQRKAVPQPPRPNPRPMKHSTADAAFASWFAENGITVAPEEQVSAANPPANAVQIHVPANERSVRINVSPTVAASPQAHRAVAPAPASRAVAPTAARSGAQSAAVADAAEKADPYFNRRGELVVPNLSPMEAAAVAEARAAWEATEARNAAIAEGADPVAFELSTPEPVAPEPIAPAPVIAPESFVFERDAAAPEDLEPEAETVSAVPSLSPIAQWSVEEVCAFVDSLEMPPSVLHNFRENAVDGDMLVGLSDGDLQEEIGMLKLQARKLRRELNKIEPGVVEE